MGTITGTVAPLSNDCFARTKATLPQITPILGRRLELDGTALAPMRQLHRQPRS
jgi:hypothetical protein